MSSRVSKRMSSELRTMGFRVSPREKRMLMKVYRGLTAKQRAETPVVTLLEEARRRIRQANLAHNLRAAEATRKKDPALYNHLLNLSRRGRP